MSEKPLCDKRKELVEWLISYRNNGATLEEVFEVIRKQDASAMKGFKVKLDEHFLPGLDKQFIQNAMDEFFGSFE